MGKVYLNDWEKGGFIQMVSDFEDIYLSAEEYQATESPWDNAESWEKTKKALKNAIESDKYREINILLASYRQEAYEGDSFVLFEKGGKLYEVNGSHCSCFGLEGQWDPEETTPEAVRKQMEDGYKFDEIREQLEKALQEYEANRA